MKTDELIKGLSADAAPRMPMDRAWGLALMAAVMLAAMTFFVLLGPRADLSAALGSPRFIFKFVVTLALATTALRLLRAAASPGAPVRWQPLLVVPALLLVAIVMELVAVPAGERMARMMGANNMLCLLAIPAIGLLPLICFLMMLRHGAPTRPVLAGIVAGLLSGGLAATFYAAHCADDSPLFVALWYSLAVAILALAGAVGAKLAARW